MWKGDAVPPVAPAGGAVRGEAPLRTNRILEAAKAGRPSFGIYVASASTHMIELLGYAGLDYVRIDMEGSAKDIETVHHMIHTAHAVGVTPFVRVPGLPNGEVDEGLVHRLIGMGTMGIILPGASSRAHVEAAVRAVKGPPLGERHAGPGGFTGGYGRMNYAEHLAWANEHILLSVQVEKKSGVEAIDEIVSIPGLDMVQSGRGDLSYEYGVPGQQYHPTVVEAEQKMVQAGLKAGKLVSVQYYPLRDANQIGTIRDYIRQGVHCLNLGGDGDLVEVYRRLLKELVA
jgi:4-hydroxy-2-oxoheptanedioate aldolase